MRIRGILIRNRYVAWGVCKHNNVKYSEMINVVMTTLKVIYHPLYGMNNDVLIWGDWLSCDPLRGSHEEEEEEEEESLFNRKYMVWETSIKTT